MRGYEGWKNKKQVVVCSTDKDAKHGPCILYNWDKMSSPKLIQGLGNLSKKEGKSKVDGEGRMFMYFQWLYGDDIDCYHSTNICRKKFGEIGAFNILKDCETDKEAVIAVLDTFKTWYPEQTTYTTWDGREVTKDFIQIAQMYLDCCRMLRWEGDIVTIEKMCSNLSIDIEEIRNDN